MDVMFGLKSYYYLLVGLLSLLNSWLFFFKFLLKHVVAPINFSYNYSN